MTTQNLVTDAHPTFERATRLDLWLSTAEMLLRAAEEMPIASLLGIRDHHAHLMRSGGPRAGSFISNDALPSLNLFPVRMMLLGLALENLAKGVIVAADPESVRVEPRAIKYPWKQSHLSVDLLAQAGESSPTENECEVVEILAEFVGWAGRFPAPVTAPKVEQRWNTGLEIVFSKLARRFRLRLKMALRTQQRENVERELTSAHTTSDHDGVTLFEDPRGASTPTVTVSCECGSFFELAPQFPAAICLCGKLYCGRLKVNHYGGERIDLDIYPPL